jgi:hypothetical protein
MKHAVFIGELEMFRSTKFLYENLKGLSARRRDGNITRRGIEYGRARDGFNWLRQR